MEIQKTTFALAKRGAGATVPCPPAFKCEQVILP